MCVLFNAGSVDERHGSSTADKEAVPRLLVDQNWVGLDGSGHTFTAGAVFDTTCPR